MQSLIAAPPRTADAPFPGLAPFGEDEAAFFFGREAEAEIALDNLLAYPISVLFGCSGAGKSSLLRAGVAALLAREEGARERLLLCAPSDETPLLEQLSAARAADRPLIVLDQFEELFAGGAELDDALIEAIAAASASGHVMIAIRDDALAQLDRLRGAIPGLFDHLVELGQLGPDAARAAIERPLEAWNEATGDTVRIERELVTELLAQLASDDGSSVNAPYLQLVMRRLWDSELSPERRVLDAGALARQDDVDGIVRAHVERALADCTPREQAIAAAMLGQLVTPSGAKVPHRAADLAVYAGVPEPQATAVLERLTRRERLLTPLPEQRYQLSHDALAAPVLAWRERLRERERRRRERRRLLAVMGFVAVLLALATLFHGLDPLELATVDARFELRGSQPAPRDVLLVTIDEASLARLGSDWPVRRSVAGDAIDWIGEGRPRVIAYDVDFDGREPDDRSLAEAIYGAGRRVVLATDVTAPGGRVKLLGGNGVLDEIGARPGYAAFATDLGGVIRHPLYAVDGVKSFAVAAAEVATGRPVASDGVDDAWIDYYGPEGTLRSVPFWKVARRAVPRSLFRDKVVVVGVAHPAIDRHPVWGVHEREMAGAEIQATAIDTVLRGLPLRSPAAIWSVLLVLAFALLPPLLSARRSLATTLLAAFGLGALYLVAAQVAFERGRVLPVVAPLAALLLASFAVLLVRIVAGSARVPREGG